MLGGQRQKEGPGCPRTTSSVRAAPTRDSFPVGTATPWPQLLTARGGQRYRAGNGVMALPQPGSTEFRPDLFSLSRQCHSAVKGLWRSARATLRVSRPPASTPRELQTLTRPRARLRDSPRCRTDHPNPCARGYVRADRPRGSGSQAALRLDVSHLRLCGRLRVGGPRWPPSPSSISTNPHAPRVSGGRAQPGRAPPDLYFPLIRSGVRLCIFNEELLASGSLEAGAQGVTRERPPRS